MTCSYSVTCLERWQLPTYNVHLSRFELRVKGGRFCWHFAVVNPRERRVDFQKCQLRHVGLWFLKRIINTGLDFHQSVVAEEGVKIHKSFFPSVVRTSPHDTTEVARSNLLIKIRRTISNFRCRCICFWFTTTEWNAPSVVIDLEDILMFSVDTFKCHLSNLHKGNCENLELVFVKTQFYI